MNIIEESRMKEIESLIDWSSEKYPEFLEKINWETIYLMLVKMKFDKLKEWMDMVFTQLREDEIHSKT